MQTRLSSFIESCVNVLIGFIVALVSQLVIFPIYDIQISITDNLAISCWFTLISIARSYFLRRAFNSVVNKVI